MIEYLWTVGRAFSTEPLPLGLALGLLGIGGVALYGLHRRAGADKSPEGGQPDRRIRAHRCWAV